MYGESSVPTQCMQARSLEFGLTGRKWGRREEIREEMQVWGVRCPRHQVERVIGQLEGQPPAQHLAASRRPSAGIHVFPAFSAALPLLHSGQHLYQEAHER